jgi:hypothetical protein
MTTDRQRRQRNPRASPRESRFPHHKDLAARRAAPARTERTLRIGRAWNKTKKAGSEHDNAKDGRQINDCG